MCALVTGVHTFALPISGQPLRLYYPSEIPVHGTGGSPGRPAELAVPACLVQGLLRRLYQEQAARGNAAGGRSNGCLEEGAGNRFGRCTEKRTEERRGGTECVRMC